MVTLKDVANYANVSTTTVSRILKNDSTLSVSPETRKKVLAAAKELQYVRKSKKIFSQNETITLAIIQWYSFEREMQDTYYLSLMQGVEDFLQESDIGMIRIREGDIHFWELLQEVQGVICIGKIPLHIVQKITGYSENIILLDMDMSPITHCCVTLDFDNAMYQVAHYFHELGHKHVGFLGRKEYSELDEHIPTRKSSFIRYCQHFGLKYSEFSLNKELTSETGYNLIYEVAKKEKLPTAIFAVNDPIALGAMRALHDSGIQVPNDVSIIGFNNIDAGSFTTPPLTTIYAPAKEMGEVGARLLCESLINNKKLVPMRIQLPCNLLIRNSCKEI